MVSKRQHAELAAAYACILSAVRSRKLQVRVPQLRLGARYTTSALMLIYFFLNLGKVRSISDLRLFLTAHGCTCPNPQPRHLGMQNGFRFLVSNGIHPHLPHPLGQGHYCLLDLKSAHPSSQFRHRCREGMLTNLQFFRLRKKFKDRCAVCGSMDGEPHLKNMLLRTTLERGHADPHKPLTMRNCIPMCCLCNRAYKDKATFNSRGMVIRWLVPA